MDDKIPEPNLPRAFAVLCAMLAGTPGMIDLIDRGEWSTGLMLMGAGVLIWLALTPARR